MIQKNASKDKSKKSSNAALIAFVAIGFAIILVALVLAWLGSQRLFA